MIINKIPTIKGYPAHIETLGPSSFTTVLDGCYLSILLGKALKEATSLGVKLKFVLPPHPNAIRGSIKHKMLELRAQGKLQDKKAISTIWNERLKESKDELLESYPTTRNWNIEDMLDTLMFQKKLLDVQSIVILDSDLPKSIDNDKPRYKSVELPLKIDDCLFGKIDRIFPDGDGVSIVDYKTGATHDESGKIKQIYQDQLNLYALLFKYNYPDIPVKRLKIVDQESREFEVDFNEKSELVFIKEIKKIIADINEAIDTDNIEKYARASEENCKYCNCRHICSKVSLNTPDFIKGTVCDVSDLAKDILVLSCSDGSTKTIAGLKRLNLDAFNQLIGKELVFANVGKSDKRVDTYIFYDHSVVYEMFDGTHIDYSCEDNFLDEVKPLIHWLIDNNKQFDKKGNYTILDEDGDVVAEAGIGWKDKKIVAIPLDSASEQYFRKKQYTVFGENELETIKQYL